VTDHAGNYAAQRIAAALTGEQSLAAAVAAELAGPLLAELAERQARELAHFRAEQERTRDDLARLSTLTADRHARTDARITELAELRETIAGLRRDLADAARLLTVAEVAERLEVSDEWVRDHKDRLGAIRLGDGPKAHLRFRWSRVLEGLEGRTDRDHGGESPPPESQEPPADPPTPARSNGSRRASRAQTPGRIADAADAIDREATV